MIFRNLQELAKGVCLSLTSKEPSEGLRLLMFLYEQGHSSQSLGEITTRLKAQSVWVYIPYINTYSRMKAIQIFRVNNAEVFSLTEEFKELMAFEMKDLSTVT